MKNKKYLLAFLLAALLVVLAGCSGEEKKPEASNTLQVVVASAYVSDEMLENLKTELAKLTDVPDVIVTALSMGDPEKDPMGAMAGMTKISAMMSSGEVDLLVTDADSARRYGDNGETYAALAGTFTEAEISAFAATPTGVALVDEEGNVLDETSAECGVILTGNASALTGLPGMQMFIFAGSTHMDAAKAAFAYLASIE